MQAGGTDQAAASIEMILYAERRGDQAVQEARQRRRIQLQTMGLLVVTSGALCVFFAIYLPPAALAMGVAVALLLNLVKKERNWLSSVDGYIVTTTRVRGPEFAPDGLSLALVDRIASGRQGSRSGAFIFHRTDNQKVVVPAIGIADSDAFWEALKRVCPRCAGGEWYGGKWRLRSFDGTHWPRD
jgi:hypothetical protein